MVSLKGIGKKYGGGTKKANDNINLDLKKGEILCIAGENGAGKTTLMKILCGLERQDEGDIFINGEKQIIESPLKAKALGIGMVHQHFMLFEDLSVAQNIVIGEEPRKLGIFFDFKKAKDEAEKIIGAHGFSLKSGQKVKDLSLGQMQQVEICRVLHRNAQIIILDEPTSILAQREVQHLFNTLKNLACAGKTIVLITHKLNEIMRICDRVAVLRRGELVGVRNIADVDEYEIARMMMGGIEEEPQKKIKNAKDSKEDAKEKIISFENVTVRKNRQGQALLDNVSFSVCSGEILGFAGVGGNGLGIVEAVLGGFLKPQEGRVFYRDKDITGKSLSHLRSLGLSYVPADRVRLGSARDASIEENLIINRRHEFFKNKILNKKKTKDFSEKLKEEYNIEGASFDKKAFFLSGGNLQKLILAREIDWLKDYIVFSEPTWGLDIASSRFMRERISSLRGSGAAVILISTNLDEVLELSDRIIVIYRGKASVVFENNGGSIKEAIGNCMQGLGA
jgi:simple sugar transport system ATP-binding protein